jgi:hypothetical protein
MSLLFVPPPLLLQYPREVPVIVLVDITYKKPDHPWLVQQFIKDFSDWMQNLTEGPMVSAHLMIRGEAGDNLAQFTIPTHLLN